jgi:hypothetical protein
LSTLTASLSNALGETLSIAFPGLVGLSDTLTPLPSNALGEVLSIPFPGLAELSDTLTTPLSNASGEVLSIAFPKPAIQPHNVNSRRSIPAACINPADPNPKHAAFVALFFNLGETFLIFIYYLQ